MSLEKDKEDDIWTLESSKKLVGKVDKLVWFLAWPIWIILESTKRRVDVLSWRNSIIKKKNAILSSIMTEWFPKENLLQDLSDLLKNWVIIPTDIKSAITIYLNTRAISLLSYLSAWDVFPWKKWKKVVIPKLANELKEEDRYVLAYWLNKKIISWSMSKYITFSLDENKEQFLEKYWKNNLIEVYYTKFMFELETLCTK